VDRVALAEGSLRTAAGLDLALEPLSERADALAAEIAELARDVRVYGETLAADPERLQQVRERIGLLRGLQRKYGADDDAVLAFLGQARERLARIVGAGQREIDLEAEAEAAEGAWRTAAAAVTAGRTEAAPHLRDALAAELEALGMPQARIDLALVPAPPEGPAGAETVELRFSGGAQQPSLALGKAASGGELSRVMLACRSVLADLDDVPTLVFDEIDAGIGGEAGLAVGARLAALAIGRQVIVVTHLPQIACFADRHVRVRKDDGRAAVEALDDDERIAELSRMLAGMEDSVHARSHAEELLAQARAVIGAAGVPA
jgi:DNA repair protein RecN (Recombination protein N)